MSYLSEDITKPENRRTGKTSTAIEFVKERDGILVCYNKIQARQIEREHGIVAISMDEAMRGKLAEEKAVTFYDQEALLVMERNYLQKIEELKYEKQMSDEKLNKIQRVLQGEK